MAETNGMNIFQRMSAVTSALNVVPKGLSVGYGSSKYSAVSERDVLDAVKPLEAKYGIYSYPLESEIVFADTLTSTSKDRNGDVKETTRFFMRLSVKYRFVNIDKPDEHVDITTFGDGIDSGDKAPGKAMTYAGKYALLKAYKVSTGDDPDAEASPESGWGAGNGGKSYKCAECGATCHDSALAQNTERDFGRRLCISCANKAFALKSQNAQSRA